MKRSAIYLLGVVGVCIVAGYRDWLVLVQFWNRGSLIGILREARLNSYLTINLSRVVYCAVCNAKIHVR